MPFVIITAVSPPARNRLEREIVSIFGYKFGYRHQFGLITEKKAKLLADRHLWKSIATLDFR
jgi:hypothetical protein